MEYESITVVFGDYWSVFNTEALMACSGYFRGYLKPESKWVKNPILYVDDFPKETLIVFKHFLSVGIIEDTKSLVPEIVPSPPTLSKIKTAGQNGIEMGPRDERLDLLIECYMLADYLMAPAFQNIIIDGICHQLSWYIGGNDCIPLNWIENLDKRVAMDSKLELVAIDLLLNSELLDTTFRQAVQNGLIPMDLVTRIATKAITKRSRTLPWDRTPCEYHEHPEGPLFAPCNDPYGICNRDDSETLWRDPVVASEVDMYGNPW